MHWNYRVIERKDVDGNYTYGIHEVYYKDKDVVGDCWIIDCWTEDSIKLEASNYEALKNMKELYMLAFDAPLLKEEELKKELKDE